MPRSVTRQAIVAIALLADLLSGRALAQISPQPTRLVALVEARPHDERVDVAVQFNCSMRYVTHLPASEGSELRVQLLPMGDCGLSRFAQIDQEGPPVSEHTGTV